MDDSSFETVETEVGSEGKHCINTNSVATEYTHKQILADTLKLITTEQTEKKKKTKTIHKFTLLTVLLSNILSISISSFTVYLVTKSHDRPDSSGYQDTHQG